MGRETDHTHWRSLKYTNSDKECSGVSYCIRLCHQQHDVSAYTHYNSSNNEVPTVLELVGVRRDHEDGNKSCHIWRFCGELCGGGSVAHS